MRTLRSVAYTFTLGWGLGSMGWVCGQYGIKLGQYVWPAAPPPRVVDCSDYDTQRECAEDNPGAIYLVPSIQYVEPCPNRDGKLCV